MSKLPSTEQINEINKCIASGLHVNALKLLKDITGMSLPTATHIIELQNNGPRATMNRADILEAYDGLWEYFKSLHVYDSQIDDLHKTIQRMTDQMQHIENERDEYKSRLNAMRTTAGLEPLSTQNAATGCWTPAPSQELVDQLTSEAQRDGLYRETGLREFGSVQPIPTPDPEIRAMSVMVEQLYALCPEDRCRVLDYLQRRFE